MFSSEKTAEEQLVSAAYSNDLVHAEKLLKNGADVNGFSHAQASYPILRAAELNHLKMVELLLLYKADVNLAYRGGATALYFASHFGFLEMVKLLLKNGAKDFPTNRNFTALYWAINNGHLEIVKTLLASGANVNSVRNENGQTPLSSAIERCNLPIVVLLLKHNAVIHDFQGMYNFITNYDKLFLKLEQEKLRYSQWYRREAIQKKQIEKRLSKQDKLNDLLIICNILSHQLQDNKEEMSLQKKPFEYSELEKDLNLYMQKLNQMVDQYDEAVYLGINHRDEKATYHKEKNKHEELREVSSIITEYLFFKQSNKSLEKEQKIEEQTFNKLMH